jgi:hypothetical protein
VTLANFGLLLIVSLFMVIPEGQSAASTQLLVSGLFSLAVITPSLVAASRSKTRNLRPYKLVIRVGASALGYVGVVVAGALLGDRIRRHGLELVGCRRDPLAVRLLTEQLGSLGWRRRCHDG